MASGDSKKGESPVPGLLKSIQKHKNFRQLASYSVKCLCKVITPPLVGWEANMEEAFNNGALEAITDVLNKHRGDEEVLSASTACLASLASRPEYAGKLVESGAMLSMAQSVAQNPDAKQGVRETMELLEVVSIHNADALVAHGGVGVVVALMGAGTGRPHILGPVSRTVERMSRVPGGIQALVEAGILKHVLEAVNTPPESITTAQAQLVVDYKAECRATDKDAPTDKDLAALTEKTEFLDSCFRVLDRVARNNTTATELQKLNGLKSVSAALDKHKDSDKVCKIGGRVLTRMASENMGDLISSLQTANSVSEKQFLTQLLSNLALEEDNANKIVKAGGLPALVGVIETRTEGSSAAARAVARIAAVPEHVDMLLQTNVVSVMVDLVKTTSMDPTLVTAATSTLLRLSTPGQGVETVVRSGGVNAIVTALSTNTADEELTCESLRFVDKLGAVGYDMESVAAQGAIPAVISALRSHPDSTKVQTEGVRALMYFADSEENVTTMADAGGVETVLTALSAGTRSLDKDCVIASLNLSTSLGLVDSCKEQLVSRGGVDTVLSSVAAFAKDEDVREAAKDVVEVFIDDDAVTEVSTKLHESLEAFRAEPSAVTSASLLAAVGRAGAFALVPSHAEAMVRSGGMEAVVMALEEAATVSGISNQETLLQACSHALMEVSDSVAYDEELRQEIANSGAVKAVITSVKQHPKLVENVRSGVRFLENYARIPECATAITKDGGIQACAIAMRANASDQAVVSDALNTMLRLGATDEGALCLAKQGGTRQVIATVEANVHTPNFQKPMEACLKLLQRVSTVNEGAEILIKQGGVDAVITAAEAASDSAKVAQTSAKVLARLVTPEDLQNASTALTTLMSSAAASGTLPSAEEVKPILSRVAHLCSVNEANASYILSSGGLQNMAYVAGLAASMADVEVRKKLLPVTLSAVSQLVSHAPVDPSMGLATTVTVAVRDGLAVKDGLACMKAMAANPDNGASLVGAGAVNVIVTTLRAGMHNREVATPCFAALASLASAPGAADVLIAEGIPRLIQDWIDDTMDEAPQETMAAALTVLAKLSVAAPATVNTLMDEGFADLLKAVVVKTCSDASHPRPEVLAAVVDTVNSLSITPDQIGQLDRAGVTKRIMRVLGSCKAYADDPAVVQSSLNMMNTMASVPAAVDSLVACGADSYIVSAMDCNSTNQELLRASASTMSHLGCGAEAARSQLERVRALAGAAAGGALAEDQAVELGEAVKQLSNLLMVDGVVSTANATDIMSVLSISMAHLASSEAVDESVVAASVASVGRLASMDVLEEGMVSDAVDMVMDVLSTKEKSDTIRNSALHAVGNMAKGASVIQVMAQRGCLAELSKAAKAATADEQLHDVLSHAISNITRVAESQAATLVSSGAEGTTALAAVIGANAGDETQLTSCVSAIISVEGGEEALLDVMSSDTVSVEANTEMLRVLCERRDPTTGTAVIPAVTATPTRVKGLLKTLNAGVQAVSISHGDSRAQQKASAMVQNSVAILSNMNMDAESTSSFVQAGGVTSLFTLLDSTFEDAESTRTVLSAMKKVATSAESGAVALATSKTHVEEMVEVLSMHMEDEGLACEAVEILNAIIHVEQAVGASVINRDCMRAIQAAANRHSASPMMAAISGAALARLATKFSDAPAQHFAQTLSSLTQVAKAAQSVSAAVGDDGRVYYIDANTGSTSWEPPAGLTALAASIQQVAESAAQQEKDNIVEVAAETMLSVVQVLASHAAAPQIAQCAAKALTTLADNPTNCNVMAATGGIEGIVKAIKAAPDNIELLKLLIALVDKLSASEEHKKRISDCGGIKVIIDAGLMRHSDDAIVAKGALSALANLAFDSGQLAAVIVKCNGVKGIERALQAHPADPRILENAMCCLSNLMFGHDDHKLVVGQTCGDEVTQVVRDFPRDLSLLKMALRALGNMCFADENIRFVVEQGAVKYIVMAMRFHTEDEEAVQLALGVLGNFAALIEESTEERKSVALQMWEEGGVECIIRTVSDRDNSPGIVMVGMDAITNLAADPDVLSLMAVELPVVPLVISIIQSHDWDEELLEHAIPVVGALMHSEDAIFSFYSADGVSVLMQVMDAHGNNANLLLSAQQALTTLAVDAGARAVLSNVAGIPTMLGLLELHGNNKAYVQEVFATLTRLAADPDLSSQIAEAGMHSIMACSEKYATDSEFLSASFRLLGHLAFVQSNLALIVQYNGIQVIMTAICDHPDDKTMLIRSIQCIDNVAMASKEYAAIVIEAHGRELVEEVMSAYPRDPDIQRLGKSAVLSMSALENLAKGKQLPSAAGGPKAPRGPPPPPEKKEDPLAEFRSMLSAGSVMWVWTKGKCRQAHVLVSSDWRSIVWQDTKTGAMIGATDLTSISDVQVGMGPGHQKSALSVGQRKCEEECAFSVITDLAPVDLEVNARPQVARWTKAITILVRMAKAGSAAPA